MQAHTADRYALFIIQRRRERDWLLAVKPHYQDRCSFHCCMRNWGDESAEPVDHYVVAYGLMPPNESLLEKTYVTTFNSFVSFQTLVERTPPEENKLFILQVLFAMEAAPGMAHFGNFERWKNKFFPTRHLPSAPTNAGPRAARHSTQPRTTANQATIISPETNPRGPNASHSPHRPRRSRSRSPPPSQRASAPSQRPSAPSQRANAPSQRTSPGTAEKGDSTSPGPGHLQRSQSPTAARLSAQVEQLRDIKQLDELFLDVRQANRLSPESDATAKFQERTDRLRGLNRPPR